MSRSIKPQILKGFRDFLPQKKIHRQFITDTLRKSFEIFGFEPLETPSLEYAEILEGKYGEEADRLIYKFPDRGGRNVALRYDLTIPLSRVVAMYPGLPKPFKCYQMSPVWRADKPQKGRFREFWQCDVDIVGDPNTLADAEIVAVIFSTLKRLGFEEFTIRINSRKLLNGLALWAGADEKRSFDLFRCLDKFDKIGRRGVEEELKGKGFPDSVVQSLMAALERRGEDEETLTYLKKDLAHLPQGLEGIRELELVTRYAKEMGVDDKNVTVDLSLARGLDYYTGPIFETTVTKPSIGSITGGGRYDRLIGLFASQDVAATGTSFGLERLIAVMEDQDMLPEMQTMTEVLVTLFSQDLLGESVALARDLREAEIRTEIYFQGDRLKKQLTFAATRGIPFVAVLGPDEVKEKKVVVRDMRSGMQESLARQDVVKRIKQKREKTSPS
jgi:histidyl-tRNA synthetase